MPRRPVPPPGHKGVQGVCQACHRVQLVHHVLEEKQRTAEHHEIRALFGPPPVVPVQVPGGPHQNSPAVLEEWVDTLGSGPRPDTQLKEKGGQEKPPELYMSKHLETPVLMLKGYIFQSLFRQG